MNKGRDAGCVLTAGSRLDAARYVDHPRTHFTDVLGDVFRCQSTSENQPGMTWYPRQELASNERPRPSMLSGQACIDENRVGRSAQRAGPGKIIFHGRKISDRAQPEGADQAKAVESRQIFGRLITVELDRLQTEFQRDAGDLGGRAVHKQADSARPVRQCRDDLAGDWQFDVARRLRVKIEPDPENAGVKAVGGFPHPSEPAYLDADGSAGGLRVELHRRTRHDKPTGSGEPELGQSVLKLLFGVHPHQPVDFLTVMEDQNRRNRGDPQAARSVLIFVGVHLTDFDPPLVLAGQFLDGRGKHATGTAPGGPKIDNYGNRRTQDFRLPVGVGKLLHAACHVECLIKPRTTKVTGLQTLIIPRKYGGQTPSFRTMEAL